MELWYEVELNEEIRLIYLLHPSPGAQRCTKKSQLLISSNFTVACNYIISSVPIYPVYLNKRLE